MTPSDWSNIILAVIASGGVVWAVLKGFLTLASQVRELNASVSKIENLLDDNQKVLTQRMGLFDVQQNGHEIRLIKLEIAMGVVEIHPVMPAAKGKD